MKTKLAAITIFLGSFLVFGIQPMVGRTLLPVFGGTAAVWVVCLCAFQVFLLGGYWYADWLARDGQAPKVKGHLMLLALASAWAVFIAYKRGMLIGALAGMASGGNPAFEVLACVFVLVGVPYMLLGSNASLVQVFAGGEYKLYAVSNAGSLAGLLAYPFIFEPYAALTTQWLGFAVGIALYAVLLWRLSAVRWGVNRGAAARAPSPQGDTTARASLPREGVFWFALPAASCFLLDSLTTHVTLDVMPMPLMWTASLAIFLLSYIIGFSGHGKRLVWPMALASLALQAGVAWLGGRSLSTVALPLEFLIYGAFLLTSCTFLHSWLYALRPDGARLTRYYLYQTVGGAVGGVVASLVFPLTFPCVAEYPAALALTAALALGFVFATRRRAVTLAALALSLVAAGLWARGAKKDVREVVYRGRGFFGTIRVLETKARAGGSEGRIREYVHGSTLHGIQAQIPGKERMPTVYYTPNACGYAITAHPKYRANEPMRVNLVGMGVGVLFAYARAGDYYRAYEISPEAYRVATDTNLFTFISGCPGRTDIVVGDARKGLESEFAAGAEPYDVIVVDAFTGDNIPYHLSTKEAFELYFRLLKPDGVLCVNISNWHLGLEPFMRTVSDRFSAPVLGLATRDNFGALGFASKVACFCRKPDGLSAPPFGNEPWQALPIDFSAYPLMAEMPTDEKGSFNSLISW